MKRLIEFPLEGGGSIMVEVDEPRAEGSPVRGAHPPEVVEKARQTFETALDKLRPTAAAIITKLRDLSEPPNEVVVEFGIKLSADAGVVLASAGAEANFTVTMTWRRNEKQDNL